MNIKPTTKTFQKFAATDQYTLIEQSANWEVVLKFSVLVYFEMHVISLSSDSGNNSLMNLQSIFGHNGEKLVHNRINFGSLLKSIIDNLKGIIGSGLVEFTFITDAIYMLADLLSPTYL